MAKINGNNKQVIFDYIKNFANKAISKITKWKRRKVYSVNPKNKTSNKEVAFNNTKNIHEAKVKGTAILKLEDELSALQQADKNFLQNLAINTEIAALPYYKDISKINAIADSQWVQSSDAYEVLAPLLKARANFKHAKFDAKQGSIIDKKTGFTAYIITNKTTQEVRLVFGGTTSGKHAGGLVMRHIKNFRSTFNQWGANCKNVFNSKKIPESYQQACQLTSGLSELLKNRNRILKSNYQLTLSGHSKGAAEAVFASLMQPQPCKTICFSSAELGEAPLNAVLENHNNNIAKANEYITHYFIENDLVPNASKYLGGLHKIGKFYQIPSKSKISTPIDRHDKFFNHIHHFIKKIKTSTGE